MLFGFGPFELDLATCKLRCEGRNVPLQPRVFGTLRYLIEHRDRVVGRQELIEALWGGAQLTGAAVPWAVHRVRKALGGLSHDGEFIQTVRGHGYRFVAELKVSENAVAASDEGSQPANPAAEPAPVLDQRPFVGRAAVIRLLTAALDAAAVGRGGLCFLSGEAGIGKTRCADEFALAARGRGVQAWIGRCFEHGIAPAFWPFIQILRAACNDPSVHDALRTEGVTLLRELEPGVPGTPRKQDESGDERFWLLDRLCRWLCRSAKGQPRLIELDDLHSADESSLQALALLTPMLAQSRLLVVATARDSASAANGRSVTTLASRLRPYEHVQLEGLLSDDVQTYLRTVLGHDPGAQLSCALYAKTAGNPLFLQEVVHVVSARYAREGRVAIDAVPLPAVVTEIISARMRELPRQTRVLLDAAAVVGEEFSVSVLARVGNLSAKDVLTCLQSAVQGQIIAPRSDGSHAFVHPLMREVLYEALSVVERAELHAEVGLALEALGLIDPPLNELAYHFHHAPLDTYYAHAARYGRAAGDKAMNALAYHEAAQCYAWALEAQAGAAPEDVAAACELLVVCASALSLAGRAHESRKQCERAIELATEAKLPDILITSARLLRPSVWLAHMTDPLALRALETALELLPEDARAQRSSVYAQLASLPPYSSRLESSRKMSAEAMRLASDSDDPLLLVQAQRSRLYGLCGEDSIGEQLQVAEEMLRSDQELTWRWLADAHWARYHASMQRGDAAAAERALDAYTRFVTTRRMRIQTWHCERLRAQRLLDAGQLDGAEQRFRELAKALQHLSDPLGVVYYRAQVLALNFERSGKRLSSELKDPPQPAAWAQRLPVHCVQRVQFAIELGQLEQAKREFDTLAADEFAAVRGHAFGLFTLVQLAGVAIDLNELDAMRQLRSLLAPYASLIALSPFTISRGCVARYLGQLEARLGRPREARDYFQHASEVNARSGHELQRLHAQLGLAQCLRTSRAPSERREARKIAARVAVAAKNLGALALAGTARNLERRLGTERRRSVPNESSKVTRT